MLILLSPWGPPCTILFALLDWRLGLILLVCGGFGGTVIPRLQERGVPITQHLWAASILIILASINLFFGELWAPTAVWMSVVILLVGLLSSMRQALIWALISAMVAVAVHLAAQVGLSPAPILPELHDTLRLVGMCAGLGGLWVVGRIQEVCREDAQARQEQARDAALAASQAKSTFLATMSHEIRTPMNGVIGVGALLEKATMPPEQENLVQVLRQSSESLMAIIDDVLDFSKIEAGYLELAETGFSPRQLADEIGALYRPQAAEKGLRLQIQFGDLPPQLIGDPQRLRQILSNLVSNTVKFTERGQVTLRLRAGDGWLRFEVEDTGTGIARDHQARLFEPFQQHTAVARCHGGTGLGLAISRQLVELMGGKIGVSSDGVSGSCFWGEIPLRVSEAAPVSAAQAIGVPLCGRVLLVEDHAVNQLIGVRLLEEMGFTVAVADDGRFALEMAGDGYDVILMDCQMPEMDGYEATRRLRAAGVETTIIALSADVTRESRERALASGMDGYLTKPIQRSALRRVLEQRCAVVAHALA